MLSEPLKSYSNIFKPEALKQISERQAGDDRLANKLLKNIASLEIKAAGVLPGQEGGVRDAVVAISEELSNASTHHLHLVYSESGEHDLPRVMLLWAKNLRLCVDVEGEGEVSYNELTATLDKCHRALHTAYTSNWRRHHRFFAFRGAAAAKLSQSAQQVVPQPLAAAAAVRGTPQDHSAHATRDPASMKSQSLDNPEALHVNMNLPEPSGPLPNPSADGKGLSFGCSTFGASALLSPGDGKVLYEMATFLSSAGHQLWSSMSSVDTEPSKKVLIAITRLAGVVTLGGVTTHESGLSNGWEESDATRRLLSAYPVDPVDDVDGNGNPKPYFKRALGVGVTHMQRVAQEGGSELKQKEAETFGTRSLLAHHVENKAMVFEECESKADDEWILMTISRPCCANCIQALTHFAQSKGRNLLVLANGSAGIKLYKKN